MSPEKYAETQIKRLALKYFDEAGISPANTPSTIGAYEDWLKAGRHGDMGYLWRHLEKKRDPTLLLPGAKSWIALALYYDTREPLSTELQETLRAAQKGWIARYARGRDYHDVIEERHQKLIAELKSLFPEENFLSCVDTKAVLERDVAARAGLGWIGKNTCLIDQKRGSFLFLSEILTTLALEPDRPVMDHCGTCTRCLDACPTGAFSGPRQLDATKCISFWTIEAKSEAPHGLAAKFGAQFFGCDICQDVCPWNALARKRHDSLPEAGAGGVVEVAKIAETPDADLKAMTRNSAMSRAKPDHLRRNARIVLENLKRS